MKVRKCELCSGEAAVFCPSDAAFLCLSCDTKVHEANFLVARHVRRAVCSNCKSVTGDFLSGIGSRPSAATCPSCLEDDDLGSLSSTNSSSACVSSTTSPEKVYSDSSSTAKQRRRTWRSRRGVNEVKAAEGVFVKWCGKLGVESSGWGGVGRAACRGLKVCVERWGGGGALPFRVCLAASMWLGLRLSLHKSALTWKLLKRLQQISGVPAKIILAAESKLGEAASGGGGGGGDRRQLLDLEEGWAEC